MKADEKKHLALAEKRLGALYGQGGRRIGRKNPPHASLSLGDLRWPSKAQMRKEAIADRKRLLRTVEQAMAPICNYAFPQVKENAQARAIKHFLTGYNILMGKPEAGWMG